VHGTEAPCEVLVKELHIEIILFTYLLILCFCDLVVSACLAILHHFFSMSVDASCMFFIVAGALWTAGQVFFAMVC